MEFFVVLVIILIFVTFGLSITNDNYHTENVSEKILETYGEPLETLFLQTEMLTIHQRSSITDINSSIRYSIETDFPSMHDHTCIYDTNGKLISDFSCALFSMHDRHTITMNDGTSFDLTSELFHMFTTVINIDAFGWRLEGDFVNLNFSIKDSHDQVIAVICQKMFSMHDRYCIDIYNPYYTNEIVTVVIVLQHIIRRRSQHHNSTANN